MKKIGLFFVFTIIAIMLGCQSNDNLSNSINVLKWGPNETKLGTIPNKQPDGKMGLWIDVSSTEGFGELQVLFAEKTVPTVIQPKLITAGIPPEEIAAPGDKTVKIKQLSTGNIVSVGVFKVLPQ